TNKKKLNRQARLRTGLWDAKDAKRKDKEGRNHRVRRERGEERGAKSEERGAKSGEQWQWQ
ncbi:MAG: hypothetical protein KAW86_03315, partial [Bacteroidales bacterium]|nr:hypothetical protein [Bacteroidales bacterium]